MASSIIDTARESIKFWWLLLLLGLVFIFSGFWVLTNPVEGYVALSIVFGVLMFVSGLTELIFTMVNKDNMQNWGWQLMGALFDFLIGLILVSFPKLTMQVIPFLVAFFFMFKGFGEMSLAIDLKGKGGDVSWGWLMIFGVIAVALGLLILYRPQIGGLTVVFYTGVAFTMVGVYKVLLGLKLRKVKRLASSVKNTVAETAPSA